MTAQIFLIADPDADPATCLQRLDEAHGREARFIERHMIAVAVFAVDGILHRDLKIRHVLADHEAETACKLA